MTQKNSISNKTLAMTAGEWRLRLAELCRDCAMADAGDEAQQLRLAHWLLALAPDNQEEDWSALVNHLPPRATFEGLLRLGAYDSAAMSLVPEMGGYILSRSGGGACLASVVLPGMDEEITAEAESSALALLSAMVACLVEVSREMDPQAMMDSSADRKAAKQRQGAVANCGDRAEGVTQWQVPAGVRLH